MSAAPPVFGSFIEPASLRPSSPRKTLRDVLRTRPGTSAQREQLLHHPRTTRHAWHCLNFFPLAHGHGALRSTFVFVTSGLPSS